MDEYKPETTTQDEVLEARRAMLKYKSESFNKGYKLEFTDSEANGARRIRDEILNLLAENMRCGITSDDERTLALVHRYRTESIDKYLYKSNLAILFGLSTVLAADPRNKRAYDAYAEGLAEYLAAAFRAYCEAERAKQQG